MLARTACRPIKESTMDSPIAKTAARVRTPLPDGPVDVAVIGCGLGGLMAAARLAKSGLRVACFDSHYVAGGCATMFERGRTEARFRFDVGLHYIGDCSADGQIPTMLRSVDVELDYVPLDADGFDTLVLPDFRFRIPADRGAYRDRLVAQFPSEERGIDRYIRFLEHVDYASRRMERSGGRMDVRTMVGTLLHGRLAARYQNATIAEVLDSCTKDIQLRAVLLGQSGDYGVAPSRVSALLHAGLANHYFRGAFYPKGGGQVIADSLADVIERAGSSVHLRCGIERILVEGGRAVGVRTEARGGKESVDIRARIVLSNADLKRTLLELVGPEHLPTDWVTRAAGFQMGGALFLTVLGIDADLKQFGLGATNYWQFDSYDMEACYAGVLPGGLMQPRGCYVTSGTLKDPGTPGHAPPGASSLEVMALLPGAARAWAVDAAAIDAGSYRKNINYLEQKQRVEDDLVARVERMFPGLAAHIVLRESATPITHTRFTRASDGTGYGLAATPAQFMKGRPGYRGPIPGLYFAGASTRAGHGIVGALSSGRNAAQRIASDLGRSLP